MTDRELLEAAAKAAGLIHLGHCANGLKAAVPHLECGYDYWDPLTDDGDAMRLAVSLGLSIMFDRNSVQVSASGDGEYCAAFAMEPIDSSEGATRRAIVRAAAALKR